MEDFQFRIPTQVLFGRGRIGEIGRECQRLGGHRVFVVTGTTATRASAGFAVVLDALRSADLSLEIYDRIEPDPTLPEVEAARRAALDFGADMVVAYGGGSPLDAGKTIAMLARNNAPLEDYLYVRKTYDQTGLPFIAVPTTAGSGSEVTAAAVIRDDERKKKTGLTSPLTFARLALIDPETHLGMPPGVTAATGMDALTHAVEAYTSRNHQPFADAFCLQAIRLIGEHLRRAVGNGQDLEARSAMAAASTLAGAGFALAGLGSVHGLAHGIGARFHVPHGLANALLLPYVMEASVIADMPRFRDIALALGEDVCGLSLRDGAFAAVEAVRTLKADLDIPATLREAGVTPREGDLEGIVQDALTYRLRPFSPRVFSRDDFDRILDRAVGAS